MDLSKVDGRASVAVRGGTNTVVYGLIAAVTTFLAGTLSVMLGAAGVVVALFARLLLVATLVIVGGAVVAAFGCLCRLCFRAISWCFPPRAAT